jgi:hypothetical protein
MDRGDSSPTPTALHGAASRPSGQLRSARWTRSDANPDPPHCADNSPPETPATSQNSQTGRITPPSTKCRLCGIPHKRHSFSVNTLIDAYAAGENVDRKLPLLSTYLGHVNPSSTYWYMEAVPELLALISARLEDLPETLS